MHSCTGVARAARAAQRLRAHLRHGQGLRVRPVARHAVVAEGDVGLRGQGACACVRHAHVCTCVLRCCRAAASEQAAGALHRVHQLHTHSSSAPHQIEDVLHQQLQVQWRLTAAPRSLTTEVLEALRGWGLRWWAAHTSTHICPRPAVPCQKGGWGAHAVPRSSTVLVWCSRSRAPTRTGSGMFGGVAAARCSAAAPAEGHTHSRLHATWQGNRFTHARLDARAAMSAREAFSSCGTLVHFPSAWNCHPW